MANVILDVSHFLGEAAEGAGDGVVLHEFQGTSYFVHHVVCAQNAHVNVLLRFLSVEFLADL